MVREIFVWPDVDAVLRHAMEDGRWPRWLVSASAYSHGVAIEVQASEVTQREVKSWLSEILPGSYRADDDGGVVQLAERRSLPVSIEHVSEAQEGQLRFLFDQAAVIRRPSFLQRPDLRNYDPIVYAFHSFKGGVGRTTSAMALTQEIVSSLGEKGRVLLVDADLEAPGISFLIEERWPSYPVSFSDLLALANDGQRYADAASEVAARIKGLGDNGVYFLPAYRGSVEYGDSGVRPEHLIKNSRDPFVISTLMRELGRVLDADAVVVDLRAGVSEISAGLSLDPTVKRVFVTTLSGQSFLGTCRLVSRLGRWDRMVSSLSDNEDGYEPPHVVLSQVHDSATRAAEDEFVPEMLQAYMDIGGAEATIKSDEGSAVLGTSIIPYYESLARIDPSWKRASSAIRGLSVGSHLRALVGPVVARRSAMGAELRPHGLHGAESERNEQRKKLEEFSDSLEFAESGAGRGFLVTDSIRNLVNDFKLTLPVVPVIGKKGAGKSYMFLQMVRSERWAQFCERVGVSFPALDAQIFPVLSPVNLESKAEQLVEETRSRVSAAIGSHPKDLLQCRDMIRRAQSLGEDEVGWRDFWLEFSALSVGFESVESMLDALESRGEKIILVADGLEDIFQSLPDDRIQQAALRSLAGDVLGWVARNGKGALGFVCFIRHDMIASAVRQNFGQFFQKHKQYALRWGRVEALRLVGWVAEQSGALKIDSGDAVDEAQMSQGLLPLWGQKLGSPNANEAHTSEWVLAALSDFRGQVQARDVVRFLKISASKSRGASTWTDRVLTPPAIRSAPEICGQKKVEEVEQESPKLKAVFKQLKEAPAEKRVIPFKPSDFDLSAADLELLEREGVILREADGYYMPEMYRHGLVFSLPRGARPRVLALARRAKGVMPFL